VSLLVVGVRQLEDFLVCDFRVLRHYLERPFFVGPEDVNSLGNRLQILERDIPGSL